jgi:hypothetical protein
MAEGKVAFAMGYNPGDRVTMARTMNPTGVPWDLVLMPKGPAGRRGGAFFSTPRGLPCRMPAQVPFRRWLLRWVWRHAG